MAALLARLAAFGRSRRARYHAALALANLSVDRQHAAPAVAGEGAIPAAATLLAVAHRASHGLVKSALRLLQNLVEAGGRGA